MAEAIGVIATYTVDRLAYSPSPPVIFAVVDFEGGGRLPVELTDTDEREVPIGGRVEMTFRRLFTADGIHNYFWKARPVRAAVPRPRLQKGRADMASHGIKDRVAIVGMGCTRFAEHWDMGVDELLLAATGEAFGSAGVTKEDVDAYWLGTAQSGHERHDPVPPAALAGQAGHPGGELLRHRFRGAAPGSLRCRQRCLRHGDGGRRGEGEGLRLPGAQRLPYPE